MTRWIPRGLPVPLARDRPRARKACRTTQGCRLRRGPSRPPRTSRRPHRTVVRRLRRLRRHLLGRGATRAQFDPATSANRAVTARRSPVIGRSWPTRGSVIGGGQAGRTAAVGRGFPPWNSIVTSAPTRDSRTTASCDSGPGYGAMIKLVILSPSSANRYRRSTTLPGSCLSDGCGPPTSRHRPSPRQEGSA